MRTWRHLLGGLLLWAAHFFVVYGLASALPGTRAATILVAIATFAAVTIAGLLFVRVFRERQKEKDALLRWIQGAAALGYALSFAAIIYQGLPAFFF